MVKNSFFLNWLPALFCVSLLSFSMVVFAYMPSSNLAFCAEDDKTLVVCFRNWANGAGNLLTVIVAMAAAFFTYRQWKASDKQVSAAILHPLEQRLQQVVRAHELISNVYMQYSIILRNASKIADKAGASLVDLELSRAGEEAINAEERLKTVRSDLDVLAVDLKYDDDICKIMSLALSLSHLDDCDDVELLYDLMIAANNSRFIASVEKCALAMEMNRNLKSIKIGKSKMQSRHSQMRKLVDDCIKLAQQVKVRRLSVLDLR